MSIVEIYHPKGTGGHRDHPDKRDKANPLVVADPSRLPPRVDLREWCPPVKHQGSIYACTAHAGT
ncbi:MAG: hypothetical protein WCF79_03105, partial [Rhodomicrobium sp.]